MLILENASSLYPLKCHKIPYLGSKIYAAIVFISSQTSGQAMVRNEHIKESVVAIKPMLCSGGISSTYSK